VIAANEGIKPQTREHLIALQAKNIKNLIIVQNKIDLVDKEKAKRNYIEIKELLKGKFDNAKIIPASAQQEVNIDKILKEITEIKIPERKKDGIPIFLIARSFDINKPGTTPENLKGAVLGGALKQGTLKENDEIEVKPGRIVKENNVTKYETIKTKVKSLFIGSKKVKEITPGGSMSIETELDMSLGKADILSGNLVSSIGNLPELSTNVKIQHKLFPEVFGAGTHIKVPPIKPGETLMLSINTSITGGSVKRATADQIEIELRVPAVIFKKDNVGIARNIAGHWRLIGYGEII
ncbi:translation initiation factor IF-2 subunit gamma, partial [Candidatus Pacearchaeota archaeon]|nr:translation initiation factor IF-2 subunit gamma [Candidatus Pacearchaeota archaeon]